MAIKVKLYAIIDKACGPQFIGPISATPDETYAEVVEVNTGGLDKGPEEEENEIFDDGSDLVVVLEVVLNSMLDRHENQVADAIHESKVIPHVQFNDATIFKSTLVSQLNGNPFFSKYRLTRVYNSMYFNNSEDYLTTIGSSSTCLLGLESDCTIFFV